MKCTIIISLLFVAMKCSASEYEEDYSVYLSDVFRNVESIKSKQASINAEKLNKLNAQLFFVPKVSLSALPKKTQSNNKYTETKITLSSLLFDDTILSKIKSNDYKLLSAVLDLEKEKERITAVVMSDQVSISLYEQLRSHALELKRQSEALYEKIAVKYNFGIIKESDVQLAMLLVQKINNEIDNLDREIEKLKLNIESNTLLPYPSMGIKVPLSKIDSLLKFNCNTCDLKNNLELKKLQFNKFEAQENANQQDPFLSVSFIAENKYIDSQAIKDESYIGIKVSAQLFNLENKLGKRAGMESYRALSFDCDQKYKVIMNQVKLAKLTSEANVREITNLEKQLNTTKVLIENQSREYAINQASVYEMLNTRFDLFQLEKSVIGMKISEAKNKIALLQYYGKTIDFFM
ncbi:TolC family protein [Escherichia coli]